MLEQARFPRYHIGESTIPAANGVLRDLEIFETLERSTFVKKMGVVFIWGRDREPWEVGGPGWSRVNRRASGFLTNAASMRAGSEG